MTSHPSNPYPADDVLVDTLTKLLSNTCGHETVQAAEAAGWAPTIWDPLAEMGAPWVGVDEAMGGSGGSIADAAAVLRLCGQHAAPVPIAETGILGGWLAGSAGLTLVEGPVTVVSDRPENSLALTDGRLSGVAHNVAWAARAERILAIVGDSVVSVAPGAAGVSIAARRNVAGEPREIVTFDGVEPADVGAAPPNAAASLVRRGAFARACLMTGSLERAAALTVDYANDRKQFGKPVATFQAVAQHLVLCAEEAQLTVMAMLTAIAAANRHGLDGAAWEISAFKAVAGEAADVVTARAHQAHGAIGMTQEYELHQLTRRLWSWRQEFGSTAAHRRIVGALVAGVEDPWRAVVHGSDYVGIA